MIFDPVKRRENLATHIALELHRAIASGALKAGERLPGQRQLAEQFGASMGAVREAISVLSATGVVEASPGRGTIVKGIYEAEPAFEGWLGVAANSEELLELLDARELIEAHIVTRAVHQATPAKVGILREKLEVLRRSMGNLEEYYAADIAFHQALAETFGSRTLARMMKAIQISMIGQLRETHAAAMAEKSRIETSFQTHSDMLNSIEARDASGAIRSHQAMIDRARVLITNKAQADKGA